MRAPSPRLLAAMLALSAVLAGCGKSGPPQLSGGGSSGAIAPVSTQGAAGLSTKNTARLGGPDPVTDAAAVARAVYPGLTAGTRPQAVVLVDERDWPAALAASVFASAPLGAPLLYSNADALPAATAQALGAMRPVGATALGGTQVVRIGTSVAAPGGYRTHTLPMGDPYAMAAAVERLVSLAHGGAPRQVIILAADGPRALQMPAAGLSAESGAPILFVTAAGIPTATSAVLAHLQRPAIYVVGALALSSRTLAELARFGPVTHVESAGESGGNPVDNAIAVARFTDGAFGWGVKEPGHGLVFASVSRPLDAPAAALLSASGDYGPLLLLESPSRVSATLARYLKDIQPGYGKAPQYQPVHGAYNHGWLIGDERAISAVIQAEIDAMLEISPRSTSSAEPSAPPAE